MLSNYERYQRKKVEIGAEYDTTLVHELLTVIGSYAEHWEDRYIGPAFFDLLRLIRANPVRLFEDSSALYRHRNDLGEGPTWLPHAGSGVKIKLSKRHPLYLFLHFHLPPEHRVWRYINCGPVPRMT